MVSFFKNHKFFFSFLIYVQIFLLAALPTTQALAQAQTEGSARVSDEGYQALPLQYFELQEGQSQGLLARGLNALGLKKSERRSTIDYSVEPGYMAHRFSLSVQKNSQLESSIKEDRNGRNALAIRFTNTRNPFFGSTAVIPHVKAPFVSTSEDENLIATLDEEGRIFMIDKINLRYQFGRQRVAMFVVDQLSLDPDKSYRLQFNQGPFESGKLELANELMEIELKDQRVANGALMLIEESTIGQDKVVQLISRANLLRSMLVEQFRDALRVIDLKPDGAEELTAALEGIKAIAGEVELYKRQHGQDLMPQELTEKLKILSEFQGQAVVEAVQSLKEQLSQSSSNPEFSFVEWVDKANLKLTTATRAILVSLNQLKGTNIVLVEALQSLQSAIKSARPRAESSKHLVEKLREIFAADNLLSDAGPSVHDFSINHIRLAMGDKRFDIPFWIRRNNQIPEDHKAILIAALAPSQTGEEYWSATDRLTMGALYELKVQLKHFVRDNGLHPKVEEYQKILTSLEELTHLRKESQLKKFVTGNDMLVEDPPRKTAREAKVKATTKEIRESWFAPLVPLLDSIDELVTHTPNLTLIDTVIAADAIGNDQFENYVQEAGLLHPKTRPFLQRIKESKGFKAFKKFKELAFNVPNLLMLGGFALIGGAAYIGDTESVPWFHSLRHVFETAFDPNYRGQLAVTLSAQLGLLFSVVGGFSLANKFMKAGSIPELYNKFALWAYGTKLSFPLITGAAKMTGQRNTVFAASKGIWPTRKNGGVHADTLSRVVGDDDVMPVDEARKELIKRANAKDRREALARNIAFKVAAETEMQKDGLELFGYNWAGIAEDFLNFRRDIVLESETKLAADIDAALDSADPQVIAKADEAASRTRVERAMKFKKTDIRIATIQGVVAKTLEKKIKQSGVDLSERELSQAELEALERDARKEAEALAARPALSLWTKKTIATIGKGTQRVVTSLPNYPLGLYESAKRSAPRKEVAQTMFNQYYGDMITQFVILGFGNGWPIQDWVTKNFGTSLPMRGDLDQPDLLMSQRDALFWTHPHEMASLSEQHLIYLTSAPARSTMDIGAASGVSNPYKIQNGKNHKPLEEPFFRNWWYSTKAALQFREGDYQGFFTRKFFNTFRFFQASFITLLVTRIILAGVPFSDAMGMYIFSAGLGMWAFAWPWVPIMLGFANRGAQLQQNYGAFKAAQRELEHALELDDLERAQRATIPLKASYRDGVVRLKPLAKLRGKAYNELTRAELKEILAFSKKQPASYEENNDALNKSVNTLFGGFLTTFLGVAFIITTFSDAINWQTMGPLLGLVGFTGYFFVNRGFWLYDKFMQKFFDRGAETRTIRNKGRLTGNSAYDAMEVSFRLDLLREREIAALEARTDIDEDQKVSLREELERKHEARLARYEKVRAENHRFGPPQGPKSASSGSPAYTAADGRSLGLLRRVATSCKLKLKGLTKPKK